MAKVVFIYKTIYIQKCNQTEPQDNPHTCDIFVQYKLWNEKGTISILFILSNVNPHNI